VFNKTGVQFLIAVSNIALLLETLHNVFCLAFALSEDVFKYMKLVSL